MTVLLGAVLVLSLGLNVFLLHRLSVQTDELNSARASASELEELRRQNQELQSKTTPPPAAASSDSRELARLRNVVSQLQREAAAQRERQAEEVVFLRMQLDAASQELARTVTGLAEALKRSPEEWQRFIQEEKSRKCFSQLKQIGFAARMWASDHDEVFPPDLVSTRQELAYGPEILFCPNDITVRRVFEWSQLNPSTISYRFLNPNGNARIGTNLLVVCPIHGHSVWSDGSEHRQ